MDLSNDLILQQKQETGQELMALARQRLQQLAEKTGSINQNVLSARAAPDERYFSLNPMIA